MKFGLGIDFEKNNYGYYIPNLAFLEKCGFDYLELKMNAITKLSNEDFDKLAKYFETAALKVRSCNCLMPDSIQMTGPDMREDILTEYMDIALNRASALGMDRLVVGSGRSRCVEPGGNYDANYNQLKESLVLMADMAEKHSIMLCFENLGNSKTNLAHSFEDSAKIVTDLAHPMLGNTLDLYHFTVANEDRNTIIPYKDNIKHMHYARLFGRLFPTLADYDVTLPDLEFIKSIGYNDTMTMECNFNHIQNEPYQYLGSLEKMREFFK